MEVFMNAFLTVNFLDPISVLEVQNLGDPIYKVRVVADKKLRNMGRVAIPMLRVTAASESLERARRANRIIEDYCSIRPDSMNEMPWITCLPKTFPDRERTILILMRKHMPYQQDSTVQYAYPSFLYKRASTEELVRTLLLSGLYEREEVIELINNMARQEWIERGFLQTR